MQLLLKQLFQLEGEKLPFEYVLPNTEEKLWPGHPVASPVAVKGLVENRAGMVSLSFQARFLLRAECDRCLVPVEREEEYSFVHQLARSLNNQDNDDFILVPDGVLELDPLVQSDISLELPTKLLCQEDCRGLCPKCGKNLNEGSCGCETKEVDPRFAKLLQLLQEEQE